MIKPNNHRYRQFLILIVLYCMSISTVTHALVYPSSWYDARAYNWSVKSSATSSYNCLAYALGTKSSWIWPWGPSPSQSEVDGTMRTKYALYRVSAWHNEIDVVSFPRIIAYSKDGKVTHFASANTWGYTSNEAKWGQLELMKHATRNPYKSLIGYGTAYANYSRNH